MVIFEKRVFETGGLLSDLWSAKNKKKVMVRRSVAIP